MLLKSEVSPTTYAACIQDQYNLVADQVNSRLKMAADIRRDTNNEQIVEDNFTKEILGPTAQLREVGTALQQLHGTVSRMNGTTDAVEVYTTLRSVSRSERVDIAELLKANAVAAVTSGADATYSFTNVPAGKYCLFAFKSNELFTIEWLVPITVKPSELLRADLYNENATRISTSTP